jgi:hypothetical protein
VLQPLFLKVVKSSKFYWGILTHLSFKSLLINVMNPAGPQQKLGRQIAGNELEYAQQSRTTAARRRDAPERLSNGCDYAACERLRYVQ